MYNDIKQTSIGISFSLDKLAALFQTESSGIDVILCSSNSTDTVVKEKLNVARELWTMGIRTLVLDIEQVFSNSKEFQIMYLICAIFTDIGTNTRLLSRFVRV